MAGTYILNSQKKSVDLPLVICVVVLTLLGLLMVFDVSVPQALKDFSDGNYYIKQQLLWAFFGTLLAFFFTNFDYHFFKRISSILFFASFAMLVAVFIPGLGISAGGAHRWLNLGFITIQPAEIIKLTGVIFLSSIFEKSARFIPFLVTAAAVTLVTAIWQKDLGSATVFVIVSAALYFLSGGPKLHFLIAAPLGILTFAVLVLTSGYRKSRILAFLDPFSDPQGFTYHILQILIALGTGGIFGVGLGQSRQKFEYIPEVTTDSIFAIIGEQFGFLGSTLVIGLFIFLILRGFKIAQSTEDNFGRILALGITVWLGVQAVINLFSMVALVPLTGVPLPFISYGGSALVANLIAIGILLNISKSTQTTN